MLRLLTDPKWKAFQESLAHILGLTLITLDSRGAVVAAHNPLGVFAAAGEDRKLGAAYRAFLRTLQRGVHSGDARVVADPLGVQTGVIPLPGGGSVVLSGVVLEDSASRPSGDLRASPPVLPALPRSSGAEFAERVGHVALIYRALGCAVQDRGETGRGAELLAGVELLNRLVLSLLQSGSQDTGLVLDLAASSLLVLLDASAAWGFARCNEAGCLTAVRGSGAQTAKLFQTWWETAVEREEDALAGLGLRLDEGLPGHHLSHLGASSRLWAVSAGVLDPGRGGAQDVLKAMIAPVAIAVEIAVLRQLLQRQLGDLLDAIRHAALVICADGRVAVLNRPGRSLFQGMNIALTVGQPVSGVGLSPSMEDGIRNALAGRRSDCEFDLCAGQFLSWTASPLQSGAGVASGVLMMIEDVTGSAVFRARAQDWEKLIIAGQMAAGMAHEIRSPLAAAIGTLQLIQAGHIAGRETRVLERLQTELTRIDRILGGYLTLASPGELGALGALDARVPLREILFLLENEAGIHGVELVTSIPEGVFPLFVGNPNGLKQVLLNLARNSVEAMGKGGRLEISLRTDGSRVEIRVDDTGPGIPGEAMDQVFRPFYTTKPHGTGLGLPVTRELVQRMRGTVAVVSRPGEGTRVTLSFPAIAVPAGGLEAARG